MQFNLADLFERVADAVPERVAVVCAADRRTYAQLDERSTRLAHVLAAHGARPGTHVALYMRNSIEHLEAMFACYKLRAVPINVNYRYVDDELAYLLDDADAVGIVHDAGVADRAERVARRCPAVRFVLDVDDASSPRRSKARRRRAISGRAPPTTTTCCTRAARRACPRASCGATRTSSSVRWAAGTPVARRSSDPTTSSRR